MKLFSETIETYLESWKLIFMFGFLVVLVSLFLLSFSTYVTGGAGFIRYVDMMEGKISIGKYLMYAAISVFSIFSLAFLTTAITIIVRARRTMDDVGFIKSLFHFPRYVFKLTAVWCLLGIVSLLIAVAVSLLKLPHVLIVFCLLFIWAFVVFLPQTFILADMRFRKALKASYEMFSRRPMAVLLYYVVHLILIMVLILVEVIIGQMRHFTIAGIASAFILFVIIVPFMEILKANLYLSRYGVLKL